MLIGNPEVGHDTEQVQFIPILKTDTPNIDINGIVLFPSLPRMYMQLLSS
jgi:hypothetical protein